MADLSITPSLVIAERGSSVTKDGNAGTAVIAGQPVYRDTAGLWQLSDANSAAAAKAVSGIALHAAFTGQPLAVLTRGPITIGAAVVVGKVYVLSGTPGGICPSTDLASGMDTIIIGVGTTTAIITVNINDTNAAVP